MVYSPVRLLSANKRGMNHDLKKNYIDYRIDEMINKQKKKQRVFKIELRQTGNKSWAKTSDSQKEKITGINTCKMIM